jgi:hypothetical protein
MDLIISMIMFSITIGTDNSFALMGDEIQQLSKDKQYVAAGDTWCFLNNTAPILIIWFRYEESIRAMAGPRTVVVLWLFFWPSMSLSAAWMAIRISFQFYVLKRKT